MELPLIYDESWRYGFILLGGLLFSIFYLGVERVLLFPAKEVPQLAIDRAIPFLPWTIWIYQSTVPFMFIIYLLIQNPDTLNRMVYAFCALLLSSAIIFYFFPTTVPRDLYPIPKKTDAWTRWNFEKLREVDKPVNCVPSMHVSMTILFTFLLWQEQQHLLPYFALFGLAIIFSTMTTKQHYAIDVITGAIFGIGSYSIFFLLL